MNELLLVQRLVALVAQFYRSLISGAGFVDAALLSEKISEPLRDLGAGWFEVAGPLIGCDRFINPALISQQITE